VRSLKSSVLGSRPSLRPGNVTLNVLPVPQISLPLGGDTIAVVARLVTPADSGEAVVVSLVCSEPPLPHDAQMNATSKAGAERSPENIPRMAPP
jgi:hypothetical protein